MAMRRGWAWLMGLLAAAAPAQQPVPTAPPEAPPVAFADEVQPPAPDYALPESWAARPGREGAAAARPLGSPPTAGGSSVDVFYVHPTTYRSKIRWNQRLDDAETNDWTDRSVLTRQAGIFNACCRVFAPRYRQASSRAFSSMPGDGGRAYALAYADVRRAFDRFLTHESRGRPFILVGHSQGALHVFDLLRDRIDGRPEARRMVAAYVFGYGLMEADFGATFPTLKPCAGPRQTRCVIGWNTFLTGTDSTAYAARMRLRLGATGARLLCSDPLTLGGARRASGMGALPAGDRLELPRLVPDAVTAACDADGVLKVTRPPSLGLDPLPDGNMHFHDMALFYADLRADAARRVAAFR